MGGEKHWPSQAEKALDVKAEKNAARAEERKQWRKEHPYGFFARPEPSTDGSTNLMKWYRPC